MVNSVTRVVKQGHTPLGGIVGRAARDEELRERVERHCCPPPRRGPAPGHLEENARQRVSQCVRVRVRVLVRVCVCVRERERKRGSEKERERERQAERKKESER